MSDAAPTPRPLPAWFARFELVLLRVLAAASLASIAIAVSLRLSGTIDVATARAIGLVGVAIMLATPFLRLTLLIAGFFAIRDRLYVGLSLAILVVLVAGLLGG
ncbi:MAG: DUF1634 domain-containing protein [Phycisphaerales bacterium]